MPAPALRSPLRVALCTGGLALVLSACSGKDGGEDTSGDTGTALGSDGERAACQRTAEDGPTVTPITQLTTQAPALQELDSPYTVELAQDRGGYVRLTADASTAGTRRVYLSRTDVVTAVVDADGGEVPFAVSAGEACPDEIPARIELELPEGMVFLLFSPSPYPSVWAVTSAS